MELKPRMFPIPESMQSKETNNLFLVYSVRPGVRGRSVPRQTAEKKNRAALAGRVPGAALAVV